MGYLNTRNRCMSHFSTIGPGCLEGCLTATPAGIALEITLSEGGTMPQGVVVGIFFAGSILVVTVCFKFCKFIASN